MKVIHEYDVEIAQWQQAPPEKFMGKMQEDVRYGFGFTPQDLKDNACYYLRIQLERTVTNASINEAIFHCQLLHFYKIQVDEIEPTVEFVYSLAMHSANLFTDVLKKNASGGNFHIPDKPSMGALKSTILKAIEIWNRKYRYNPTNRPNWQPTFRNLPEIPLHKQWRPGSYFTREQDIAFKLMNRQVITREEETIFLELSKFYDDLDKKLAAFDYELLSEEDFDHFENYIFFAFNYLITISNKLTVFHTIRLVVNESVQKKDESITNICFLKYPPLDVVKNGAGYNRASTYKTTVFYSTENIDTALKETRPPLKKLVTAGVWRPKDVNKPLISFPISHSDEAFLVNQRVQRAMTAISDINKGNSLLLNLFMSRFLNLLGREFSKVVDRDSNREYLISAMLSERILDRDPDENPDFQYDCIIYPSVGNNYLVDNIAVKPSTIDKDFQLVGALEFRIQEADYDLPYIPNEPFAITLAKVTDMRWAKTITAEGVIIW
jgi:hypothetical protein